MKLARRSFGEPYECKKDWPESCEVQCGDNGIVFAKNKIKDSFDDIEEVMNVVEQILEIKEDEFGSYRTAFFEVFPKKPDTFIRGEGKTVEEAEERAWEQFEKINSCPGHEFEKRGYRNGSGICKHCNLFKYEVFEPWEKCEVCGKLTYDDYDENGVYCLEHSPRKEMYKRLGGIKS